MNNKMNYLFERVCKEYKGAELGKKATQKIFYFFERQGVELNLRYGIHYYGPYSQRLSDYIDELETEGIITVAEEKRTHVISWNMDCDYESELDNSEKRIVDSVLANLYKKTPVELEALSTMDYVKHSILSNKATDNEIVECFLEIKGKKFNRKDAFSYLAELSSL